MKSETTKSQSNSTLEILMDLTSLIHWEIKVLVVLAIPYHSPKLLNLDLSNAMERRCQFYHHSISWCATILMKVAMVDGLSSTDSCLKMATWFLRSAPHTKQRLRAISAKTMSTANQSQRSNRAISSEEPMESHLRRKWWKKFLGTVLLMENLMFQESSLSIRRVFFRMTMRLRCPLTLSTVDWQSIINKFSKWLVLSKRDSWLIVTSKTMALPGWISITPSWSPAGALMKRPVLSTGSYVTHMERDGEWTATFWFVAVKTISALSLRPLATRCNFAMRQPAPLETVFQLTPDHLISYLSVQRAVAQIKAI